MPRPNLVKRLVWPGAAVAAPLALLYWRTVRDFGVEAWTDPHSSQGLLIPPICAFLAWTRREETLSAPAVHDPRGLWLLGLGCLILLTGIVGAEAFLARISGVLVLTALILAFWGAKRLTSLAFPLILLATAIPLPALVQNALSGRLQLLSSLLSADLAGLLGLSVFREGNILNLSGITLGVFEACSGLNSLLAMTAGSMLVGLVESLTVRARVLLVIASVPLTIVMNVIRITATAVLAERNIEAASGFYHLFSGWFIFLGGFLALYVVARRLPRRAACS